MSGEILTDTVKVQKSTVTAIDNFEMPFVEKIINENRHFSNNVNNVPLAHKKVLLLQRVAEDCVHDGCGNRNTFLMLRSIKNLTNILMHIVS